MIFDLQKFDTANLISLVQLIAVIVGFYFSYRAMRASSEALMLSAENVKISAYNAELSSKNAELSARNADLATRNAQANLFNHMVSQGRDLQHRYVDLNFGGDSESDKSKRRDQFAGTLMSYYASCFELRNIMDLPESIKRQYDNDLKSSLCDPSNRQKYELIKINFSREFNGYVSDLMNGV